MSSGPTVDINTTKLAIGMVVTILVGAVFEGLSRIALGSGLPGWLATSIFIVVLIGYYVIRA